MSEAWDGCLCLDGGWWMGVRVASSFGKYSDNGAHQVRLIMIFLNMVVPARLSGLSKLEFSSCTMKVVEEIRA